MDVISDSMAMVALTLLVVAGCVQGYLWIVQFSSLSDKNTSKPGNQDLPAVSIVIAAKNESQNLKKHLRQWLSQEYEKYEVIIVNDHSSDDTREVIAGPDHRHLTVLDLPKGYGGKKDALEYGIRHAKYPWILLTDADCYPQSGLWIDSMMSQSSENDVLLGYGPYRSSKGCLGAWIQYETWFIAMQYFSSAIRGKAYMGVGRNMAFRKDLFTKVGGYSGHRNLKSGDDDLFISGLLESTRTGCITEKNSWTWSYPKRSWTNYINQKRRHLTTAPSYRWRTKIWLIAIHMSHVLWYVGLVMLIPFSIFFVGVAIVRWVMISVVALRQSNLKPGFSLVLIPVIDIFHVTFYSIMSMTFLFAKKDW